VQSLLHEVVVLHHVRGKTCSLFFVRQCERRSLEFVLLSDVRCLFPMQRKWRCWYWLGAYRLGYLLAWLPVGLTLIGHSCMLGHLSASLFGGPIS